MLFDPFSQFEIYYLQLLSRVHLRNLGLAKLYTFVALNLNVESHLARRLHCRVCRWRGGPLPLGRVGQHGCLGEACREGKQEQED